jgi:hypothetical protein
MPSRSGYAVRGQVREYEIRQVTRSVCGRKNEASYVRQSENSAERTTVSPTHVTDIKSCENNEPSGVLTLPIVKDNGDRPIGLLLRTRHRLLPFLVFGRQLSSTRSSTIDGKGDAASIATATVTGPPTTQTVARPTLERDFDYDNLRHVEPRNPRRLSQHSATESAVTTTESFTTIIPPEETAVHNQRPRKSHQHIIEVAGPAARRKGSWKVRT